MKKKQNQQAKQKLIVSVAKVRELDERKLSSVAGGQCGKTAPVNIGND